MTVHTKSPVALQLFVEGRLLRVGSHAVEVMACGRELGAMALVEVNCGDILRHDVAILVFNPMSDGVGG